MIFRLNDNKYCDDQAVNTLLVRFEDTADSHHIRLITDGMDTMFSPIDGGGLAQVLTLALEMAVELCDALPEGRERYIKLRSTSLPNWCMAISNPCGEDTRFDEDGFPLKADGAQDPRGGVLLDTLRAQHMSGCFSAEDGTFTLFFLHQPSP